MKPFSSFSLKHKKGFTLLELLIVLAILVLGFTVVAFNISSGKSSLEHQAAVKDIVSALRYARAQAMMFHQEKTVAFNLAKNTYTVSGRGREYSIPMSIDVTIVTAQSELTGKGQGNFRFYPDGSSSGGRILLERGPSAVQIDISWLTGDAKIENVSGN